MRGKGPPRRSRKIRTRRGPGKSKSPAIFPDAARRSMRAQSRSEAGDVTNYTKVEYQKKFKPKSTDNRVANAPVAVRAHSPHLAADFVKPRKSLATAAFGGVASSLPGTAGRAFWASQKISSGARQMFVL